MHPARVEGNCPVFDQEHVMVSQSGGGPDRVFILRDCMNASPPGIPVMALTEAAARKVYDELSKLFGVAGETVPEAARRGFQGAARKAHESETK